MIERHQGFLLSERRMAAHTAVSGLLIHEAKLPQQSRSHGSAVQTAAPVAVLLDMALPAGFGGEGCLDR